MDKSSVYEKINEYVENNIDEMLESLAGLMRIPSVAVSGNVAGMPYGEQSAIALKYIKELSEKLGLRTREFANYVVTADYGIGEPELAVLAHVDVVPQGEGWTKPCFDMTVENGRVYGRGAIDDKGPAVASLYAVKAIEYAGIELLKPVRYIFGGGEELGCDDILYYTEREKIPDKVITPDGEFPIVNAEKGMAHIRARGEKKLSKIVSITSGDALNAVPAKAVAVVSGVSMDELLDAVSYANLPVKFTFMQTEGSITITAEGKSAHGSRPQLAVNALTAMFKVLGRIDTETVAKLSELFCFDDYFGKAFGIAMSDEISGELTLALTVCNYTNGCAEIGIDCRFPVSCNSETVVNAVKEKLESIGYSIYEADTMEPHYVDENCEFIASLKSAYEKVTGEKAYCISETGVTYAHSTEGGVAFGAEMEGEDNCMHSADESISIERLKLIIKVYAQAILEICKIKD